MRAAAAVIIAVVQALASGPIPIGRLAPRLNRDDITWIERLSVQEGGRAWLIDGEVGADDVNRPFTTDLVVTDEELISIVRFLRTGPVLAAERELAIVAVVRTWNDDQPRIALTLRRNSTRQVVFSLERSATTWTVLSYGESEAD